MDGRAFLQAARVLSASLSEPNWRSATGRAYYGLLHEGHAALGRWGFVLPPRANIHTFVRLRFNTGTHPDLVAVSRALDNLGRWRNEADYHLTSPGLFATASLAGRALSFAQTTIGLLDTDEADPARRAVIAALRAAWP
jgi:hypothetical protein